MIDHRNECGTAGLRTALQTALDAALADNAEAERAAATYRDLAGPCTDMLLTAYVAMQLREMIDTINDF